MNALRSLAPVVALAAFLPGCSSFSSKPAPETAGDPRALREGSVPSSDGVSIHYIAGGRGDTALVFVHGWTGNARWWTPVMEHFAPGRRVVALDLAGHGSSGRERTDWTVERFADDVAAVVRALDLRRVVLLGHSMSGTITVQAARLLGDRVVLLVPVDTLNDVEWDLPPEVWAQFFGGLRADFPGAVEGFFRDRLASPDSPPAVIDSVVAQARAADPELAVPMLERAREFDLKAALRELRVPIRAINSDRTPTRLDTNKKYAPRFAVELMPDVGHWPMLEEPDAFIAALERVLAKEQIPGN